MQIDLQQIKFLQGLRDESLAELALAARAVTFAANSTIFRQGDLATDAFFLVSGLAALEICSPGVGCRRIATVASGELLGWSPILLRDRLFATARSLEEVQAIAIPGASIQKQCESDPAFGYGLMKRTAETLATRLSATRLQLLDIFGAQQTTAGGPA